jgi:hypothetical protein
VIEFLKVFGSRPEDFGTPPEGYGVRPLFPPACSSELQGASAFPEALAGGATGEAPAAADTLLDRAWRAAEGLRPPTRFGGEP